MVRNPSDYCLQHCRGHPIQALYTSQSYLPNRYFPASLTSSVSHLLTLTFSFLDTTKWPLHYSKPLHLAHLSVPPNCLSESSASLGNLQSLDIYLPSIHYLASTSETISSALHTCSKSIKSTLTIPFDDPFKPDGAPFNPFAGFREHLKTDGDLDTSLTRANEKPPFTLPEGLIIVDFFLTGHAASVNIGNDLLTFIVPQWLMTWFPNLKRLTFSESKGTGDSSCNYWRRKLPFLHIMPKHTNGDVWQ